MSQGSLADLELRHLSALRAVAEEGTFGRAAARLGFTQSAVSQQIAALERVVGEPVFDRPGGPRPVTLTPAGRIMLRHANTILDRVRGAESELDGLRSATTGRLAIGMFQSVSVRIVPRLLTELRRNHPKVEIVLFESDSEDLLVDRLRDGELDLTFTVTTLDGDLTTVELFTDPFLLVCPLDSPIVPRRGPVPVDRLSDVPMVGQPMTTCSLQVERALLQLGVESQVVFRSADNGAVQAMVAAGVGHAVMPRLAIDMADKSVIVRETTPPLTPRSIGLAYLTGRTLPPIAEEFIAMALRQSDSLRRSRMSVAASA